MSPRDSQDGKRRICCSKYGFFDETPIDWFLEELTNLSSPAVSLFYLFPRMCRDQHHCLCVTLIYQADLGTRARCYHS